MSAKILDGKTLAMAWQADIKVQVDALGVPLHVAAVCGSGDSGLAAFVRLKQKAAESIGMVFSSYFFSEADEAGAIDTLKFLAADETVQGILVELPVPASWNREALLSLIPKEKDVDVISPKGEKIFYGDASIVLPPAVRALEYMLTEQGVEVKGVSVAVVGVGALIGKPIAHWLASKGALVNVIDIDTPEPAAMSARADIVIAGVGKAGLITSDWIAEGAMVVDFGYSKSGDTYVGDVDMDSVVKKAGILTPVPGGMGPLVVAAVLENTLTAALP